ncbi:ABC transporter permease [Microlunatus parietis]|uniref:Putative ABC transport system permease protein n=1 Tax=Microlunatus parietis TaxID=682979 RepID=A0A7Y9I7Q7_9ACTN|nr:ABC transporter permease [Microlunatus parietis]NYE71526.1 putative ABC transport system permease protein [Microlunatus parietis]
MIKLVWRTLRGRAGGFVGAFVALVAASALLTACGTLLQSGLTSGAPPQRYAGAPLVVGAEQTLADPNVPSRAYGGRVRVPAGLIQTVAAVPGVQAAIGDVAFPVLPARDGKIIDLGRPAIVGHGWAATELGPYPLREGRAPNAADELVLDQGAAEALGLAVGERLTAGLGGIGRDYRLVGIVAPGPAQPRELGAYFTEDEARRLSGHPDQMDAIGIIPAPGADLAVLEAALAATVTRDGARVYAGDERGMIEFLDLALARGNLVGIAGSFGGVALMVALFIVAGTLGLQVQQRRRELALLRAIAATPRQVRRLIALESVIIAVLASLLGLLPGLLFSSVLRDAFATIGVVPADFMITVGPVPLLVAVVLCLGAALVAGLASARRAARIRPVEALGEAAVQSPRLGVPRALIGCLLLAGGLGLSLLPLIIGGDAATGSAAMSVIVLVIAVALLGPRLVAVAIRLSGRLIRRGAPVSGYLAAANTAANSRRLTSAITPLVLAIAIASVQLFTGSTRMAVAAEQAWAGLVADIVVSGQAGLSPQLAERIATEPGVAAVTPVIRTQVIGEYVLPGARDATRRAFGAQGVAPAGLSRTVDLDVRAGSTAALVGDTVALSQTAAEVFGAGLGDRVRLHLADGTPANPAVVAIYGNGLGFGDLTLPRDRLLAHSPYGLDDLILITAAPGALPGLRATLDQWAAASLGVAVFDRTAFTVARQGEFEQQNLATMILLVAVFGYIAIGVANTLVMATATRRREFALLRLVGAQHRQVIGMVWVEALVVIVIAVLLGTAVAMPPLVGVSLGLSERADPIPAIDPLTYLAIIGATAAIAVLSMIIPTLRVLRDHPVEAIGSRE